MSKNNKVLILGAFSPEIRPLQRVLRKDRNIQARVVGVGLINAALETFALIKEHSPAHVFSRTSAGLLD